MCVSTWSSRVWDKGNTWLHGPRAALPRGLQWSCGRRMGSWGCPALADRPIFPILVEDDQGERSLLTIDRTFVTIIVLMIDGIVAAMVFHSSEYLHQISHQHRQEKSWTMLKEQKRFLFSETIILRDHIIAIVGQSGCTFCSLLGFSHPWQSKNVKMIKVITISINNINFGASRLKALWLDSPRGRWFESNPGQVIPKTKTSDMLLHSLTIST